MKHLTLIFLLGFSLQAIASVKYTTCSSTEEYIRTLKFLRKNTQYAINEKKANSIALEVSKHCSNSSKRFLKILKLLSSVGIDTNSAIKYATTASMKSDKQTAAFIKIYKSSFRESDYNLDALTSLKIASSLTFEYEGKVDIAIKDFGALRDYCMSTKGPNLDMKTCSNLSGFVAKQSEKYEKPMFKPFKKLINYLQKDLGLSLKDAIALSKKIIIYGPSATKNFQTAYKFGASEKGLKRTAKQAVQFALSMAAQSNKEISNDN